MMKLSKHFTLSQPDEKIKCPENWFVIRHDHIDKATRKSGKYYGKWFRIKLGDKSVYRCLKLSPTIEASKIVLDWGAALILGAREKNKPYDLEIKSANCFERFFVVGLKHIDPTIRMNTKLALLGLFLGATSLAIALIGFFR